MNVDAFIKEKIAELNPSFAEVANESHMHAGPATDSHFKLTVVATAFEGKRAVARHQLVYGLMDEALKGPVHALALHLYTPSEWQEVGSAPESPLCAGKNG